MTLEQYYRQNPSTVPLEFKFGGEAESADVALATMSAPLAVDVSLRDDPAVRDLVAWGAPLLPPDIRTLYQG